MLPTRLPIVSPGPTPPCQEKNLCDAVGASFDLTCRILDREPRPEFALNKVREQYDALELLAYLEKRYSARDGLILAITDVDLFISVLTFVFGEARLSGRAAVISTFRLREQYYGRPSDEEIFFSRVEKSAIHEVGHMLGLVHCADLNCVMHASNTVADTDVKSPMLCPNCHAGLRKIS